MGSLKSPVVDFTFISVVVLATDPKFDNDLFSRWYLYNSGNTLSFLIYQPFDEDGVSVLCLNLLFFRVKTRNGQYVVDSLKMDNSIGELKAVVWSVTKLHPDKCRVLMGYPPEEVYLLLNQQC